MTDVIIVLAALTVLLPLFIVIYLIVRMDGGPGLFFHSRVTRYGARFSCLKFRTMCLDAEERLTRHLDSDPAARAEWAARQKLSRDPRITPIGVFLRRTSLDELPQLINVLRGEMSLVGPRPVTADELQRYGRATGDYLRCLPGVTGLWQVTARRHPDYLKRVAADRFYAQRRCFFLDASILIRTVPSLILTQGE